MSLASELWGRRHEHPVLVALSVFTVASMLVWPLVDALLARHEVVHVSPYGFNDFGAYYIAVDNWLSGEPIYTEADDGGFHGSYLYPPFVLPLFYPFAQLGFNAGGALFGAFSLVLLWVGIEAVLGELGYDLTVAERLLALFALFGFQPALWNFKWGQVSTLLAALLCFAFYAHERGEHGHTGSQYLSGILTALASGVKLFYATSGTHLLRDWRRFLAGVGTAVFVLVASLTAFGWETHRLYLDVLAWGKGWGAGQHPPAPNQTAYYRPLYLFDQLFETLGISLPSAWMLVATAAGIFAVIVLVLLTRTNPAASRPAFALGVTLIPLFAPRAYTHDLVVLLLPALVLFVSELEREDGYPLIPVIAVLLLHTHTYGTRVSLHLLDPSWAVLLQPGVYGTLLLVGLAAVRTFECAPENLRDRISSTD